MSYSNNTCFFVFTLMLTAVSVAASTGNLSKDVCKGVNAVNVIVVATEPGVILADLEDVVVAVTQWCLPMGIDAVGTGLEDANVSVESEDGENTRRRPRFKAGANLSSSVN